MNQKEMLKLIDSIRRGRRAIKMRDADPEQVAQILDKLLKEVIMLQSSGGFMGESAMKEMKQVAKDLTIGKIKAGKDQKQYIGKYLNVLGQFDQVDKRYEGNNASEEYVGALRDSLPSTNTIVSALMTANPMLGYGVKIITDIKKSVNDQKKIAKRREEEKKRLAKSMLETEEGKKEVTELEKEGIVEEQKKEKRAYKKREGIYTPILKNISGQIDGLSKAMGIVQDDYASDSAQDGHDLTQRIVDELEEGNKLQREVLYEEAQKSKLERKTKREKEAAKGQEDEKEADDTSDENLKDNPLLKSNFSKKISGMIKPFLDFAKSFGVAVVPLIGAGTAIGSAIYSIIKFLDGLFLADKILGRDVDWGERIFVGIANIFASVAELLYKFANYILGTNFEYDKTLFIKPVIDLYNKIVLYLSDTIEWVIKGTKEIYDKSVLYLSDAIEWTINAFKQMIDTYNQIMIGVSDAIEWIINVPSLIKDAVTNFVGDAVSSVVNKFQEISKTLVDWVDKQILSRLPNFIRKRFDVSEKSNALEEPTQNNKNSNVKQTASDNKEQFRFDLDQQTIREPVATEEEKTISSNISQMADNDNERFKLEQEEERTKNAKMIDSMLRSEFRTNRNTPNYPLIMAPSTQNNTVNQIRTMSSSSDSSNSDPSHRRWMLSNHAIPAI